MPNPLRQLRIGTADEHEKAFLETLIEPVERERWRVFLTQPRYRKKALDMLDRAKGIDLRQLSRVKPAMADCELAAVIAELEEAGAPPEAYAISTLDELDGRFVPLSDTLARVLGWQAATFLSCIPGRLGYMELEGKNERYLFKNPLWIGA